MVVQNDDDNHIAVYPDIKKALTQKTYCSKANKAILDDPISHTYLKSLQFYGLSPGINLLFDIALYGTQLSEDHKKHL